MPDSLRAYAQHDVEETTGAALFRLSNFATFTKKIVLWLRLMHVRALRGALCDVPDHAASGVSRVIGPGHAALG